MVQVETQRIAHRRALLEDALATRIVVLDGAMGSILQAAVTTEEGFRGEAFRDHDPQQQLLNCCEVLCISQPDLVRRVHTQYLEAGAEIIETNTFNACSIALEDFGLQGHAQQFSSCC